LNGGYLALCHWIDGILVTAPRLPICQNGMLSSSPDLYPGPGCSTQFKK